MKTLLLCLLTLAAHANWSLAQDLEIVRAFPNLTFARPMDIQSPPDGTDRLFIAEKGGLIRTIPLDPSAAEAHVFLDIEHLVTVGGDLGIQGLAFAPDFGTSGYFFVHYAAPRPNRSVISRFQADSNDPQSVDPETELVILELTQPSSNHNGGQIAFGPDGYLYVPFGDGGGQNDTYGHGQNLETWHSAILRLDVSNATEEEPYAIPQDNPLVGNQEGHLEEIYAYGFRNPWRSSFGPLGKLWVGDVGQGSREEINWIVHGGNYGWSVAEGTICHSPSSGCDMTGMEPPLHDYNRSAGRSVTGGHVYTATDDACMSLHGKYIYGDYVTQRIWAITYDENGLLAHETLSEDSDLNLSTFGRDRHGRVYMANYGGSGTLHQFACSSEPPLPVTLSSFEAFSEGRDVHLVWQTASETNNAGFDILHRGEGTDDFVSIVFEDGVGTTEQPQSYAYTVRGLSYGEHQFQLKQVDFDGAFELSDIVSVEIELNGRFTLSAIHPNPFNPQAQFALRVNRDQHVSIELHDVLGRRLQTIYNGTLSADADHSFAVDGLDLPSGNYLVRVTGDAFNAVRHVTLLK